MTTSTPLSCDAFAGSLMDYLEHDASVALRGEMDAHAAGCAECAALLADFRAIARDAAHLPVLEPSRDLWAGIAARIETPVVELTPAAARRVAPRHWRRGLVAAGLVAAVAGGWAVVSRSSRGAIEGTPVVASSQEPGDGIPPEGPRGPDLAARPASGAGAEPEPGTATARSAVTPASAQAQRQGPATLRATQRAASARLASNGAETRYRSGEWRAVDSIYGAEIGRLRRLAAENRSRLDPATLAVLEKNIRIIDQAILESRAAIARDPNSALLNDQVNRMLDQKVELLRAISTLPARS